MRISGGRYKNFKLTVPKGGKTRPTIEKLRQTLFNICRGQIEGAKFLDVFAGSGAIGIEALSWGAKHVTFIEKSRAAICAIKENLSRLNLIKQATILSFDAFLALKQLAKKKEAFDLIFIDPPYGQKVKGTMSSYLDTSLSFIDQSTLLKEEGILFCEESTPLTAPLKNLTLQKKRQVGGVYLYQFVSSS